MIPNQRWMAWVRFPDGTRRAGLLKNWTTHELRHSFVSLVADQLDDLAKVSDLAGHVDTRTTEGYRHQVRASLPHAVEAWNKLLDPTKESGAVTAAQATIKET